MSLLPSKPDAEPPEDAEPRVIGVDSEDADEVLSALSSGTARELLAEVHQDPAPPSELAERVDTSLQNAQYHLEKLENAGAVEVVDTGISAKGREMDVYAAADQPLVIFAGDQDDSSLLRSALQRLVGALGALALASLVVQAVFGEFTLLGGQGDAGQEPTGGVGDGGGGDGADGGGDLDASDADGGDGADGGGPDGGDGGEVGGGDDAEVDATSTPEPEPQIEEATTTPVEEMTSTAEPEATATPQPEATATPQPEPSPTELPSATPQPEATPTPQPEPTSSPTPTEPVETVTETVRTATEGTIQTAADAGPDAAGGLPPGLLFFAGGAFVILVVTVVWYSSQ